MSSSSPSEKSDASPIRESWSFKKWFRRAREPDDATSKIILRPGFFRREPASVKPFPPRTLTFGIPGLPRFHLHFNSTRKGQAKGWNVLGNRITWSRSSAGEYRMRKLATRQLRRYIAEADGKLPKGDVRDPRFSSSGSFGFPWIGKLSTALRANPFYQWGRGEAANGVNPMTLEAINLDARGRPYDPDNPDVDPFGNTVVYDANGQPVAMGPPVDPRMYAQMMNGMNPYGQMGMMNGQYGPSYSQLANVQGVDPSVLAQLNGRYSQGQPFDPNDPYTSQYVNTANFSPGRRRRYQNDPGLYDPSMYGRSTSPYGRAVGMASDPRMAMMDPSMVVDPRLAMMDPSMDPRMAAMDPSSAYGGRRVRGAPSPPTYVEVVGDPDPIDTDLTAGTSSPSFSRSLGRDSLA